jgi:hypothetical protein
MTSEEAIDMMLAGYKVRHPKFASRRYIYMPDGNEVYNSGGLPIPFALFKVAIQQEGMDNNEWMILNDDGTESEKPTGITIPKPSTPTSYYDIKNWNTEP